MQTIVVILVALVRVILPSLAHDTVPHVQIPIDRATGGTIASPVRGFLPFYEAAFVKVVFYRAVS